MLLQNGLESPLEVLVEQTGVRRSIAPGEELVTDWTWSGFADLICGPDRLALSVPDGGAVTLADPAAADPGQWGGSEAPGGGAVREFWIHNATTEPLLTFWEPWCGEGNIPPGGGPARVEWTGRSTGVAMIYEPTCMVVWDLHGGCRAWRPDGVEVFTGGSYVDPDEHPPLPAPGWPR